MIAIVRQGALLPMLHARHSVMTVVVLAAAAAAAMPTDAGPAAIRTSVANFGSISANAPALDLYSPTNAGHAQASNAARATLRWYLASPLPYENGAWMLRGYVRNDESVSVSGIRMTVTFADGSVVERHIVDSLQPGDQFWFEFREVRPAETLPQAVLWFMTTR